MRAFLDTNIFISYLIDPQRPGAIQDIFKAFRQDRFTLLTSSPLIQEMTVVVSKRPHLARHISKAEVAKMQKIVTSIAEVVPLIPEPLPAIVRDRKDDYLVAYATVGKADYLVTGDDDLLVLKKIGRVKIVTPAEFVSQINQA